MAEHFTATVEITKTTSTPPTPPAYTDRRHSSTPIAKVDPERSVDQLARFVIRESTLDALRDKVGAHVALIGGGA